MAPEELEQVSQQRKPARTPGWVWAVVGAGCGFLLLIFLGIVAAIAIPSILVSKGQAENLRTKTAIMKLSAAMEDYFLEHGRYPTASSADEIAATLERENHGANLPRLDAWGHPLIIEVPSDGGHYYIISMGQNGLREAEAPYAGLPRVNTEPGADIVFGDGEFLSLPTVAER